MKASRPIATAKPPALRRLAPKATAGFGATVSNPTTYTNTITYTFDAGNRLTQAVDSIAGTITRQYDNRFDSLTRSS